MRAYFTTLIRIFYKDLVLELKSKDIINSMLFYALIIIVIFSFVITSGSKVYNELSVGIIWIAIVFSGVLGLNRAVLIETVNDSIVALMLAPVDISAIFFGKVLSITIFILLMEIIIIPVFTVFYNINIFAEGIFPIYFLLFGTYGFALLGSLFSFMTIKTRAKELLLPLLLLPLIIPILLAGIKGISLYMGAETSDDYIKWFKLLVAFDIIFTLVIYMLIDKIFEE
jgi:heme exporter protein B